MLRETSTFHRSGWPEITFVSMQSEVSSAIIYAVKAKRLFWKAAQKYVVYVVLNDVVWSSVNNVKRG